MPGMIRRRARRRAIVGTAVVAGAAVHQHHLNKNADEQAELEQQAIDAQAAQQQYAAAPASAGIGTSQLDELTKLAELHSQGILNDAEFAAQKAKILGS